MSLRLTFDVNPDERQIGRVFSRFAEYATDMREAWDDIEQDFIEGERRQFASQGRSGSGGWAPLNPRYAAYKRKKYGSRGILVATGRLRSAAIGGSELRRRKEKKLLELEITTPYARFHQAGTSRMPQRRVIELTTAQKRTWGKIVQKHLVEARNKAFAEARR
jgi:phage gpG-like protein